MTKVPLTIPSLASILGRHNIGHLNKLAFQPWRSQPLDGPDQDARHNEMPDLYKTNQNEAFTNPFDPNHKASVSSLPFKQLWGQRKHVLEPVSKGGGKQSQSLINKEHQWRKLQEYLAEQQASAHLKNGSKSGQT